MTVAQILAHSSNVGAITLAQLLGEDRLARWISRFGFGQRTGIDFPGESAGHRAAAGAWSGSTIGNVPIGQGIAVTPIQMAAAYAAIANGGVWCSRTWSTTSATDAPPVAEAAADRRRARSPRS